MRLIDILNKIANGELKEGTVVVWDDVEYPYKNKCLYGADGEKLFYWINTGDLNDEVELIEPDHFADDGKMAETNQFRGDTKMIEPTDNTKIEELIDWYATTNDDKSTEMLLHIVWNKLNEVIRKINKEV